MSELTTRTLTGLIGAPVLLWIFWLGGPALAALCTLLAFQAFRELHTLLQVKGTEHSQFFVLPYVLALPLIAEFGPSDFLSSFGALTLLWAMILFLRELFAPRQEVMASMGAALLAGLLAALPFASMMALSHELTRLGAQAGSWLLLVALCIFSVDTFAYFGGRLLGKHKLFERVSPKKTVEGFLVGLLASILAAWVLSAFLLELNIGLALFVGLLVGLLGPAGDLIESRLKRDAGVKDSASLLPGHGGVLDRFDSWIILLPTLYLIVRMGWFPF